MIWNNLMPLLVTGEKSSFKAKCTLFLSVTDPISAWSEMDQKKSSIYTNFSWIKNVCSLSSVYFTCGASSRDELSKLSDVTKLPSNSSQIQQLRQMWHMPFIFTPRSPWSYQGWNGAVSDWPYRLWGKQSI